MDADAIIVGAGMAGLVAARRLWQKGFRVLVLEAENRVGGRVFTDHWNGYAWDAGTQFITSRYRNTIKLLKELNLYQHLVPIRPRLGICNDRGLHRGSLLNPAYYFKLPGLGFLEGAKLFRLLASAFLCRYGHRCSPIYWSLRDTDELANWANRKFGPWASQNLLEAVTAALYFTGTRGQGKFLLEHTLAEICTMQLYTLKNGLGSLPQALAKGFTVLTGSPVAQVKPEANGVAVQTQLKNTYKARLVVIAVPAPVALWLFSTPEQTLGYDAVQLLRETQYSSCYAMSFPLAQPVEEQVFGVAVAPVLGLDIGAVTFERMKDPARIPAGGDCGVVMARRLPVDRQDAADLANQVDYFYSGFREKVLHRREYPWQRAVAAFPPGRMKQLASYAGACARPPVYLCGDYWLGPSLECAVTSGFKVAEFVMEDE